MPGILDLHRHVRAVLQRGAVHLPDRGGGDRLLAEVGEHAAEPLAQVLLDDLADLAERMGLGGGLELGELALELLAAVLRDEADVDHREGLSELHRGALHRPQHRDQPLRRLDRLAADRLLAGLLAADDVGRPGAEAPHGMRCGDAAELRRPRNPAAPPSALRHLPSRSVADPILKHRVRRTFLRCHWYALSHDETPRSRDGRDRRRARRLRRWRRHHTHNPDNCRPNAGAHRGPSAPPPPLHVARPHDGRATEHRGREPRRRDPCLAVARTRRRRRWARLRRDPRLRRSRETVAPRQREQLFVNAPGARRVADPHLPHGVVRRAEAAARCSGSRPLRVRRQPPCRHIAATGLTDVPLASDAVVPDPLRAAHRRLHRPAQHRPFGG